MACDPCYRWSGEDLLLNLKVLAGASVDEITGETLPGADNAGAWLRIKVAAPPVEGKANKRLRKLLADLFGVPRSSVEIVRGENRQYKQVKIRRPHSLPDFIGR